MNKNEPMEFNINSTEQNVWLAKLITALQGQGAQFKTWKDGNLIYLEISN